MSHLERLLKELSQLQPLSEWGIDRFKLLELIREAQEKDSIPRV